MELRVRAFRAVDDLNACQKYVKGHMEVLRRYGITMITTANIDWFVNPNVVVIAAESKDGQEMLGGMRIHVKDVLNDLPIESAVGGLDQNIYPMVNELAKKGTGEFCGMWNAKDVSGKGISYLLTSAGTAVISQLAVNTMFVLCAEYTVHMVERVGFNILTDLGNDGTFYYPKLDLVATALIKQYNDFSTADIKEKMLIQNLRSKSVQTTDVTPYTKTEPLEVEFDLELPPPQEKFLKNSA